MHLQWFTFDENNSIAVCKERQEIKSIYIWYVPPDVENNKF